MKNKFPCEPETIDSWDIQEEALKKGLSVEQEKLSEQLEKDRNFCFQQNLFNAANTLLCFILSIGR